jgi:hypothetical protein
VSFSLVKGGLNQLIMLSFGEIHSIIQEKQVEHD